MVTTELPDLRDGQVSLRTVYLSLDPYMRGRTSAARSYARPVEVGDVMVGGTVCEVLGSRSPDRTASERAPEAFRALLAGRNYGKLLVRVGDDPTLR